jgi:hypothetical protein
MLFNNENKRNTGKKRVGYNWQSGMLTEGLLKIVCKWSVRKGTTGLEESPRMERRVSCLGYPARADQGGEARDFSG